MDGQPRANGAFASAFTDEQVWEKFEELVSTRKVARFFEVDDSTIRRRLAKIRDAMGCKVGAEDINRAGKMEQLVSSIPLRGPGGARLKEAGIKIYGIGAKDQLTQKIVTEGMDSTSAVYGFDNAEAPKFPVIQPATPTTIAFCDSIRILRKTRSIPIISDAQIGYLRDADTDQLEPTHDPLAMDIAKQIVRDIQPSEMVIIGDWMDWQTFSRWQQYPEYDRVVQPSIETGYNELGEFKSAAGKRCGKITMIGSNHGYRPEKFVLEYNKSALYVKQAGQPESWPVFSEPFLLRYDELGITFSGQYPGGEYYILPDLVAMHAPPKSREFGASVLHGHTHKITRSISVQHRYDGRQTAFTYDVGCLCQTGSSSNARRLLRTRVPSDRARTDWAQGIAVVNIVDGKFPTHAVEQIFIHQGQALYGGQQYVASALVEAAA